jgi:hypothetical protein
MPAAEHVPEEALFLFTKSSAYDMDARRIDPVAPTARRHQTRPAPGWKASSCSLAAEWGLSNSSGVISAFGVRADITMSPRHICFDERTLANVNFKLRRQNGTLPCTR